MGYKSVWTPLIPNENGYFYDLREWDLFDLTKDPNELTSVYGQAQYAGVQRDLVDEPQRLRLQYRVPDPDPLASRPPSRRI